MEKLLYAYLFFMVCFSWLRVLSNSLLWLGARNADLPEKTQTRLLLLAFGNFALFLVSMTLLMKTPEYLP